MYTTPPIGCVNFLHPNKTINVLWSEIVSDFFNNVKKFKYFYESIICSFTYIDVELLLFF